MSNLAEKTRSQFIRYGIQRANRFRVTIPLPKEVDAILSGSETQEGLIPGWVKSAINLGGIMLGLNSNGQRSIQFVCRATEVPGVQFGTESQEYNGHTIRMATGIERESVNFTFQLSEDVHEKKIFDSWKSLIVNETTRQVGYFDDYTVDIQIDILNLKDDPVYTVYLIDAYPMTIQSISLNKMATDMANALETSWAFTRLSPTSVRDDSNSPIPGSIGEIIDGIANGDLESAAYAARKLIVQAQNGNFTGEAGAIFSKIDEIVRSTTGVSVTEMEKVGGNLQSMVNKATGISDAERLSLTNIVGDLLKF